VVRSQRQKRPVKAEKLGVWFEATRVGSLRQAPDGAMEFRYDPTWLANPAAFPVTSALPLSDRSWKGASAYAAFDNLLPDAEGELRARIAERTAARGSDAYALLSALGRDCVGALQFLPEGEVPGLPEMAARPINEEEIAKMLRGLAAAPLGLDQDDDFRISIAGAQEKTALLYREGRWWKPLGGTPTSHILKTPIGVLPGPDQIDLTDSVENEAWCLRLAHEIGLPVANARIGAFGDAKALIVERFDRRWENGVLRRLAQEDLCQALGMPSALKYQRSGGPGMRDILRHLQESDDPASDRRMFLKAQIFFLLIGATDGHAKNFSLALGAQGRFRLAPLYDILSLAPVIDAGRLQRRRFRLAMSFDGHYGVDEILPRHIEAEAVAGGLPPGIALSVLRETCEVMPSALERTDADLGPVIPETVREPIARRARSAAQQMLELLNL
jgi:serine/threonine-protein kinase HipA